MTTNTTVDWAVLERIDARIAAEKARLAGLQLENEADKAALAKVAKVVESPKAPWWLVRWF